MRRKSAASARFAIRARAMFPMLVAAVRVRVMTTVTPARSSSARSRSPTRRLSSASRRPLTTPLVPPPSLIFRVDEPGPIGSVSAFARRSWPGSMTTTWLLLRSRGGHGQESSRDEYRGRDAPWADQLAERTKRPSAAGGPSLSAGRVSVAAELECEAIRPARVVDRARILRHGAIDSFRTRFPAESKKTIVSGTSVFFIQKPPREVAPGRRRACRPSAPACGS